METLKYGVDVVKQLRWIVSPQGSAGVCCGSANVSGSQSHTGYLQTYPRDLVWDGFKWIYHMHLLASGF